MQQISPTSVHRGEVKVGVQQRPVNEVERVNIRFAGDSGDGMQLTGNRFTTETALFGNDLRTFPDYPAEIRAPAGTLAGVSAFQISFASREIHTPGDAPDILVAMNPAALKSNIGDLKYGGTIIVNSAQFNQRNLVKVGYQENPLENDALMAYKVHAINISGLTATALDDLGLPTKTVDRCNNLFALGVAFWLYNRTYDTTIKWIENKFKRKPELVEANIRALKAGHAYGETTEIFDARFQVKKAEIKPGTYRNINGNSALAMGFIAASEQSGRELFLGSYPITPASTILHELSKYKHYGVHTFQAEDEIAAICATIGAAFGGALAITSTSGPGLALKGEALGLSVMTELPMVLINVQRGGPSTGLPTKTEQSDLLQALYGRNGEAPLPVLAACSPSDSFDTAFEASRIAMKYMTPVILLSDGYIANGTEPWKLPDIESLPVIHVAGPSNPETFQPYMRDPETLARPWPHLGTPGFEHRLGGLEKENVTGGVSYDPQNHELMIRLRDEKINRIAQELPPTEIYGDERGDVLLLGWGSTFGAIRSATQTLQKKGHKVSCAHLRYIYPLPGDLEGILKRFKKVVIPEMNLGQLAMVLRAKYLLDIQSISKVQGQPFKEHEIADRTIEIMEGKPCTPFLTDDFEHELHRLNKTSHR